ncbi:unnamed protein product [Ectocarpus sp. CCAP 1310/34]|nr:unnamed protein product [Ectocarpus sp. CCAP 1310/34]
MSFSHAKGILHRNLKSANVVIFSNGRLKLCDFGLSKVKTDLSSESKQGAVGTTQRMSQEMDESAANELIDVYSFGVLCFEVVTRIEPFKEKKRARNRGGALQRRASSNSRRGVCFARCRGSDGAMLEAKPRRSPRGA